MLQRSPFGTDDFGYSYFSGTNRLQTIGEGLTAYNYTYDKNGNMTSDQLNRTGSIKYDHRNLMTDVRAIKTENGVFGPEDITYWTVYRYDEAGNRVRKTRYKYTGSEPDPIFDMTGDTPPWTLQSDEFYVRDVSGKEIALYSGSSLTQWNIWGLDNVGKINADTTRNYYLKDHLGSIRAVLNSTNTVISAQDYDAWGYPLENRSYNGIAMKYDFTGKERDDETSYDYFGARYYDSRIANWTSIDPLLEKHYDFSPYNYVLRNPIRLIDPDGKQIEPGQQIEEVEPGGDPDDIGPMGRPVGNISLNYSSRSNANTNARLSLKTTTNWERNATDPSSVLQPKISSETLQGLSLNKQAIKIYEVINKNSIDLGGMRLDLKDQGINMGYKKGHYDKATNTRIPVPHVTKYLYYFNKGTRQFGKKDSQTLPATQEHINQALEIINHTYKGLFLK